MSASHVNHPAVTSLTSFTAFDNAIRSALQTELELVTNQVKRQKKRIEDYHKRSNQVTDTTAYLYTKMAKLEDLFVDLTRASKSRYPFKHCILAASREDSHSFFSEAVADATREVFEAEVVKIREA